MQSFQVYAYVGLFTEIEKWQKWFLSKLDSRYRTTNTDWPSFFPHSPNPHKYLTRLNLFLIPKLKTNKF